MGFIKRRLEMVAEWKKMGIPDAEHRQTGRSLALAFHYLSKAMQEPGKWHRVKDHHDAWAADLDLIHKIGNIVKTLDLQGFSFKPDSCEVRFSLKEQ